jgi:translation initiation factor IF-3
VNEQIRISPVRLIAQDSVQVGIVSLEEALRLANDADLDLVEVAPTERPPVCRIMDYGKWKYLQKQKNKQHHPHESQLKEIRIRPKTDVHDREIKINRARTFLQNNDKVQFTMLFRGRERMHRDMGRRAFDEIVEILGDIAKIEREIKMEGRRMTMVLAPSKASK